MPIGKAVSIAIDAAILSQVDAIQPSHFTRKAFVNQLILEALEQRTVRSARMPVSLAE
jgi:hypothetical protein